MFPDGGTSALQGFAWTGAHRSALPLTGRRRPGHHRRASGRTGPLQRPSVEPGGPARTPAGNGAVAPAQRERQARWYRGAVRDLPATSSSCRARAHREGYRMTYPKADHEPHTDAQGQLGRAPEVPSSPRFPQIEERVSRYWDADGTFRASVEQRDPGTDGSNEFVFYDAPPFANGLPHYGHLLTGYVKDVVPRYQTMRGR